MKETKEMRGSNRYIYWSSAVEQILFWWKWSVIIYHGDDETKSHGYCLTKKKAQQKRDYWLMMNGEIP